ncbi:MAG: aspartate aminotransferase family protein [Prevotellaceae bacterium]|jgi:acetylornithine/succinyldiaminopimelate/putrescine aminotransferase|nr:aspartate aminotransferase family protein [Prevotellaceae bacterium]
MNETALNLRTLFLQHVAQTSDFPMCVEVARADGIYIYSPDGKAYIDLIAGVSVSNVGHCHPKVVEAVKLQAEKYMHVMVYGEYVESPQVLYAKRLTELLPANLSSVYFVNSGSESVEGALKLAKRYTNRTEMLSFKNAYHGSSHGAVSVMGNEEYRNSFRPLLPDTRVINFNDEIDLNQITERTACVIAEPIQGEAGIIVPTNDFLKKLRKRCDEKNVLLIFDEIQTGFGRTGKLFAFEQYNVIPDILCVAKSMGGGMPLGAFISSNKIMSALKTNPALGYITTFGGHPVSCAAALASLNIIIDEKLLQQVNEKSNLFRQLLTHKKIKEVRGEGLFFAVELACSQLRERFINKGIEHGLLSDWFLFCDTAFRISPPLTITNNQIKEIVNIINSILDEI